MGRGSKGGGRTGAASGGRLGPRLPGPQGRAGRAPDPNGLDGAGPSSSPGSGGAVIEAQAPLALARCFELWDADEEAEKLYQAVLAERRKRPSRCASWRTGTGGTGGSGGRNPDAFARGTPGRGAGGGHLGEFEFGAAAVREWRLPAVPGSVESGRRRGRDRAGWTEPREHDEQRARGSCSRGSPGGVNGSRRSSCWRRWANAPPLGPKIRSCWPSCTDGTATGRRPEEPLSLAAPPEQKPAYLFLGGSPCCPGRNSRGPRPARPLAESRPWRGGGGGNRGPPPACAGQGQRGRRHGREVRPGVRNPKR